MEKEISWAKWSESRTGLEATVKLAKSEPQLADSGEDWDSDTMLLGVANGVIDLRTGSLREGKPSDKITLHTEIACDPEAQCPRWNQFLNEVFDSDAAMIEYIHRAVGYCLTGDTREQCLFACHGLGANGKSTLLEIIRHLLGGYAYNLPFSAFELEKRSSIPNDLAPLPGKRFVTAIETNDSAQLNEGRIKLLTGGDPISARFLRREFFTFVPVAKYWLSFNNAPSVTDDSHGFWRRIKVIPFRQRFDGDRADDQLIAKLKAEAQGILNWAILGCIDWQRGGLGMPPAVAQAIAEYRDENDPLSDFIEEQCVLSPEAQVEVGALRDAYIGWASDNLERAALDRKALTRRLKVKGFQKRRFGKKRDWTWFGITLRSDHAANQPSGILTAVRRT